MDAKEFLEAVLTILHSSNTVRVTKMNDDLIVQGDDGEIRHFDAEEITAMRRKGPMKDQRCYTGPTSAALTEEELQKSLRRSYG